MRRPPVLPCPSRMLRQPARLVARREFGSTPPASRLPTRRELIQSLLRNEELTEFEATNEVRWILQAVNGGGSALGSNAGESVKEGTSELVLGYVERRAAGEPLQYILGTEEFGPLTIKCRAPTLIPRPETAHITSLLVDRIRSIASVEDDGPLKIIASGQVSLRIHDLCTGSGCIALLLSHHLPHARISATDLSPSAIALARENAAQLGKRIEFEQADLMDYFKPFGRSVEKSCIDLVVSNPPYIPRTEWNRLLASVREHEDPKALIGDPTDVPATALEAEVNDDKAGLESDGEGLAFYRRIAHLLSDTLTPHEDLEERGYPALPRVAVEVGKDQASAVASILETQSQGVITRTEIWEDQYGVPRMVVGFTD